MAATEERTDGEGAQRLSVERLDRWRALDYGMFIHYGLATFTSEELGGGKHPIEHYQPLELDVDQWVRVARDAGMSYVILTAKHARDGGFSNWPSRYTDFSVARAPEKTDVVGAFVNACHKHGVKPALYMGGDFHNVPGGQIGNARHDFFTVTRPFMDHMLAQLDELVTEYGPLEELWFDGPHKYGVAGRNEITDLIASRQPDAVVAMNGTWEDNGRAPQMKAYAWPSDVIVIEAGVPPIWGTGPWRKLPWDRLGHRLDEPVDYYLPVENCVIGHTGSFGWWWGPNCRARNVAELLGIKLLCRERNANCVLNAAPDRRGKIPDDQARGFREVAEWERAITS